MSSNGLKPLAGLLDAGNSGFSRLADAAQRQARLSDYMRKHLDRSLAAGFIHCSLRDDSTLVVTAVSPEWAARLRFASERFIELSKEQGLSVASVKVRVGS